jgi:hypothetical protein
MPDAPAKTNEIRRFCFCAYCAMQGRALIHFRPPLFDEALGDAWWRTS